MDRAIVLPNQDGRDYSQQRLTNRLQKMRNHGESIREKILYTSQSVPRQPLQWLLQEMSDVISMMSIWLRLYAFNMSGWIGSERENRDLIVVMPSAMTVDSSQTRSPRWALRSAGQPVIHADNGDRGGPGPVQADDSVRRRHCPVGTLRISHPNGSAPESLPTIGSRLT